MKDAITEIENIGILGHTTLAEMNLMFVDELLEGKNIFLFKYNTKYNKKLATLYLESARTQLVIAKTIIKSLENEPTE